MSAYFLALDIGGTKTSGALFTENCELVDDYVYTAPSQTFKGEEAVYQNTKNVLETVLEHFSLSVNDVRGIGVGSPARFEARYHYPCAADGLEKFSDRRSIKKRFSYGCPDR